MTLYDPGYGPLVSTRVRIATWNLWGRYGPWAERMRPIEASMRAVGADIWALRRVRSSLKSARLLRRENSDGELPRDKRGTFHNSW